MAAAVFTVRAGTRVRVSEATVDGSPSHLTGLLREKIDPRPGQPFRRAEATKAAEEMRALLLRLGYGRARVESHESYDPAAAQMRLSFTVDAGPVLTLDLRGDRLPDPGLRARLERLIRDGGAAADALEEGRDLLERAFLELGHRQVAVSYRAEPRPRGEAIVYDVKAGPVAIVESVRVAAEEAVGLEASLLTRPETPLRDRIVEEDVRTLTRLLEDRGFPEAKLVTEVPDGGGRVPVVFRVQEGRRVMVSGVRIDTPVPLPEDSPPRELRLRSGVPYRVRDLARDRASLLSAYRDSGYPDADVVPAVTRSEDGREAQVTLKVIPGTRVDVDHIVIAGLDQTREEVVRRELTLKEGEPFGLNRLLESQRRLAALGIFSRVSVSEIDPESPERRSLLVQVEEAPRTTVAYGIGAAEGDLLRGSVEVTHRNLFGMDRSLSAFARVSFKGSRFLLSYREPFLFGRRQDLFLTAFREEEDRPYFDYQRHGGIVQAVRPLTPTWNLIARYTYQNTDSFNIVNPGEVGREFAFSTLSGPAGSVVNDTRDDPLDPHRGRFVSADLVLSARLLGGNSFAKSFLQAAVYHRLQRRTVLALSGRLGLARTFGLEESIFLPRPDRFYAGGDYSMRGYDTDAVAPLGGNALLLGNAELRIDVGGSVPGGPLQRRRERVPAGLRHRPGQAAGVGRRGPALSHRVRPHPRRLGVQAQSTPRREHFSRAPHDRPCVLASPSSSSPLRPWLRPASSSASWPWSRAPRPDVRSGAHRAAARRPPGGGPGSRDRRAPHVPRGLAPGPDPSQRRGRGARLPDPAHERGGRLRGRGAASPGAPPGLDPALHRVPLRRAGPHRRRGRAEGMGGAAPLQRHDEHRGHGPDSRAIGDEGARRADRSLGEGAAGGYRGPVQPLVVPSPVPNPSDRSVRRAPRSAGRKDRSAST